ncbi:MAG TPA: CHAT domain-containing protein, partial [Thermoanaerobaculia bacterium]|nr:CHAT domain-containing protein [Thermoanaerobaculia bacterium]
MAQTFHGGLSRSLVVLVALVATAALGASCRAANESPAIEVLTPGETVTARLAEGAVHAYGISVPAGHLLHLVADQEGVDVVLTLRRSTGEPLLEIDSPSGSWGPEELWWIAPDSGVWRLEVRPWTPAPRGRYQLRALAVRPASSRDGLRAAAARNEWEAGRLLAAGDAAAARRELTAAREMWRRAGVPLQEALAGLRLAAVSEAVEDAAGEVESYRSALTGLRRLGQPRLEVFSLLRLGEALRKAGDLAGAWEAQEEALGLAQRRGLKEEAAFALNNLALILEARGETGAARERYRHTAALFRRLGLKAEEAMALHSLGTCSSLLGRLKEAEAALTAALALRRSLGDVRGEGATLTELGWVYHLRALAGGGETAREKARGFLQEALLRRREARDSLGESGTLDRLGTVYRHSGLWNEALACYQRSLVLIRDTPPGRRQANTLSNLAELWLGRGRPAKARELATEAVARFAALPVRDAHGEIHARYLLGRAAAGLGDLAGARRELEQVLSTVEALRSELGDQTLTLAFFAQRQLYFEGAIETLMNLDALYPGQGFDIAALETSERARMRTLLDSLAARRRRAQGKEESDEARPMTAERIQRELLDGDTVLLEVALGEERGFLWVVSRERVEAFRVPGWRVLRPLVEEAYRGLRGGGGREASRQLVELLLGPAVDRLDGGLATRRLAVVTDGLLAHIPFSALPWGEKGRPLVESYEIVRLPSATALAMLRQRAALRPAAEAGATAVVADPVFSTLDPRVHRAGGAPP